MWEELGNVGYKQVWNYLPVFSSNRNRASLGTAPLCQKCDPLCGMTRSWKWNSLYQPLSHTSLVKLETIKKIILKAKSKKLTQTCFTVHLLPINNSHCLNHDRLLLLMSRETRGNHSSTTGLWERSETDVELPVMPKRKNAGWAASWGMFGSIKESQKSSGEMSQDSFLLTLLFLHQSLALTLTYAPPAF